MSDAEQGAAAPTAKMAEWGPRHGGPLLPQVIGDRVCVECGFNLIGQPVSREPATQLAVATCPECGRVTALNDAPRLARWRARLGVLAGLLWAMATLALVVFPPLVLTALANGAAESASASTCYRIFQRFEAEHPAAGGQAARAGWWGMSGVPAWWWQQQDPDQFREPLHLPLMIGAALWLGLGGVVLGMLLAGVLLQRRVIGRLLVAVLAIGIGAGVLAMVDAGPAGGLFGGVAPLAPGSLNPMSLGIELERARWLWLVLGPAVAGHVAGVIWGRALLRGSIVLLVPPRLRPPFGVLWSVDGRRLPAVSAAGAAGWSC